MVDILRMGFPQNRSWDKDLVTSSSLGKCSQEARRVEWGGEPGRGRKPIEQAIALNNRGSISLQTPRGCESSLSVLPWRDREGAVLFHSSPSLIVGGSFLEMFTFPSACLACPIVKRAHPFGWRMNTLQWKTQKRLDNVYENCPQLLGQAQEHQWHLLPKHQGLEN